MTDRPIIYSAPMIRALLAGRKRMTRRLVWKEDGAVSIGYGRELAAKGWKIERRDGTYSYAWKPTPWQRVRPGDRLWVRESLRHAAGKWTYAADDAAVTLLSTDPRVPEMIAWAHHQERTIIPSIHMPRWASRIALTVTETRIEPLQDISAEDAEAEGVQCDMSPRTFIDHFRNLWVRLHGPTSWKANPEVVVITFDPPEIRT